MVIAEGPDTRTKLAGGDSKSVVQTTRSSTANRTPEDERATWERRHLPAPVTSTSDGLEHMPRTRLVSTLS